MILLPVALAALLATQAPAEDRLAQARTAFSHDLAEAMRKDPSPRLRALGAQLWEWDSDGLGGPERRGKLLRTAAEAAPGDALVQAIWANTNDSESGCNPRSPCPERSFAQARVEPDNGIAWVPAFNQLGADADEAKVEALLERMAAASRMDDHFAEGVRAHFDFFAAHPEPPELQVDEDGRPSALRDHPREGAIAMSFATAAFAFPDWQGLVNACKRSGHSQAPTRRFELCGEIGRKMMAGGTTFLTEAMGSALLRVTGQFNDDDRKLRRRLDWRMQANADLAKFLASPEELGQYYADLQSTGNESRTIELFMQRHGVAIDPPADYKSPEH
jgi:hypothetical protein